MEIHETQCLQEYFKGKGQFYREIFDIDKALTKQIVAAIEKKYLQVIDNSITKSITKPILDIIWYLLERYGQVRQTKLNEHKAIIYTLAELLSTVFTKMGYVGMLAKAVRKRALLK